jgi:predicted unusual protein kinase regulating ubiquinone biosynthesis (AarF/ABC1/UbiB family)
MAFVEEFGDLLYELPFQIPENLLLLGRGLSILSGICSGLDPDFNVWNGVMPYAEKLIANEAGRGKRGVLLDESLDFLKTFISLPKRTEALLQRIEQGKLEVQMPELKGQITRLDRHVQRLGGAVLFASFFMGGVQLYLAHAEGLAIASGAAALISLLWILLGR